MRNYECNNCGTITCSDMNPENDMHNEDCNHCDDGIYKYLEGEDE